MVPHQRADALAERVDDKQVAGFSVDRERRRRAEGSLPGRHAISIEAALASPRQGQDGAAGGYLTQPVVACIGDEHCAVSTHSHPERDAEGRL